jgi:hypothetical protein
MRRRHRKADRPRSALKSGVYWAVDPATGKGRPADPGQPGRQRPPGGIEYGTATDGKRIYAAEGDPASIPHTLGGSGPYAGQTNHWNQVTAAHLGRR